MTKSSKNNNIPNSLRTFNAGARELAGGSRKGRPRDPIKAVNNAANQTIGGNSKKKTPR